MKMSYENEVIWDSSIEPVKPDESEVVRRVRNSKLKQSDWTQIPDSPVDSSSWATYRQSLRDVPQQQGFPYNVTWPTPPEG